PPTVGRTSVYLAASWISHTARSAPLLLYGRPHDRERDTLQGEGGQGGGRNEGFAVGPTLEGDAAGQIAQGPSLRRGSGEANADHGRIVSGCCPLRKVRLEGLPFRVAIRVIRRGVVRRDRAPRFSVWFGGSCCRRPSRPGGAAAPGRREAILPCSGLHRCPANGCRSRRPRRAHSSAGARSRSISAVTTPG